MIISQTEQIGVSEVMEEIEVTPEYLSKWAAAGKKLVIVLRTEKYWSGLSIVEILDTRFLALPAKPVTA